MDVASLDSGEVFMYFISNYFKSLCLHYLNISKTWGKTANITIEHVLSNEKVSPESCCLLYWAVIVSFLMSRLSMQVLC